MADGYGNVIGYWRVHCAAWVTSYDDTSDVIHVEARWQSIAAGWDYRGYVAATVWVNGQQVGHVDNSGSRYINGNEVTVCTGDLRVAKVDGARSITCSASIYFPSGYHGGTSNASCGVPVGGINYKNPDPPRNVAWSRVDDSATNLTWASNWNNEALKPWKQIIVDRWMASDGSNNATWGNIAVLGWDAVNYRAGGQKPNSKIGYALYARNQRGDSSHVNFVWLYTTPAAPKSLTAAKTGVGEVTLTADVSNSYAWSVDFERTSDNGATWTSVSAGLTASGGKVVFKDTAAPAGIIRYRARAFRFIYNNGETGFGNGGLFSPYVESNTVTTITPPLAPTITSPANGSAWSDTGTLTISWTPNHPDGSAQTAAQAEIIPGQPQYAWTQEITGATTRYDIEHPELLGTWRIRVRTKGLHEDWGAWSDYASCTVATPPNVVITKPADTVTELPFDIEWSVVDATGVSQQRVAIVQNGVTVYEATPSPDVTGLTITGTEFLPVNNSEFTVTVTVRGGSTLTAATSKLVTVEYTPPAPPLIDTTVDADTLAATHTIRYGDTPDDARPDTVSVLVRRIIDGDTVVLSDGLTDGHQVIDPLPPLRYEYTVEAVAIAASGANSVTRATVTIDTDMCCLTFGPDAGESLPIGGAFTVSEKPELATEEYHFATGDADGLPHSYQMRDLDNALSVSSTYDWGDGSLYRRIRRLAREYAYAWFRNMDGARMRVRVSISQKLAADGLTVDFSASLDEIAWKEPAR